MDAPEERKSLFSRVTRDLNQQRRTRTVRMGQGEGKGEVNTIVGICDKNYIPTYIKKEKKKT